MKKQLVIIHGGDFFDTRTEFAEDLKNSEVTKEDFLFDDSKGWKDNLPKDLGKDFEVFAPEMPNRRDAKYAEWKIWFEKMLPFLDSGVVLVGQSLGGIFLARYLSENDPGVRVGGLFLVAAPFFKKDGRGANKAGFVVGDLRGIGSRADRIFVMHSKDDPIAAFSHAEKYCAALPHSIFVQFKDRGHFIGQERFPEIVKLIQKCG